MEPVLKTAKSTLTVFQVCAILLRAAACSGVRSPAIARLGGTVWKGRVSQGRTALVTALWRMTAQAKESHAMCIAQVADVPISVSGLRIAFLDFVIRSAGSVFLLNSLHLREVKQAAR